jgi:hypothetical protein
LGCPTFSFPRPLPARHPAMAITTRTEPVPA